jgi:hypothetical protein
MRRLMMPHNARGKAIQAAVHHLGAGIVAADGLMKSIGAEIIARPKEGNEQVGRETG